MTIKAYGTIENFKSTTIQQTKQTEKGQALLTNTLKTHEILFAEFRIESQGKSNDSFGMQNGLTNLIDNSHKSGAAGFDLSKLQFNGRSILDFTQDEAAEMISENGHFGIKNTAARLSDFVVNGAGDNLDRLKTGREGILRGFEEAEELWGGTLPDISYKTIEAALARIDARIQELGGQVVDTTV